MGKGRKVAAACCLAGEAPLGVTLYNLHIPVSCNRAEAPRKDDNSVRVDDYH